MNTENIPNESHQALCYEYRTYNPLTKVVTYNLTYDRGFAYTHDQFAIPLYVQTVELPENSKGILLHKSLSTLKAVDDYFCRNPSLGISNTHMVVKECLKYVVKILKASAREFGNRHDSKTGDGTLQVKK